MKIHYCLRCCPPGLPDQYCFVGRFESPLCSAEDELDFSIKTRSFALLLSLSPGVWDAVLFTCGILSAVIATVLGIHGRCVLFSNVFYRGHFSFQMIMIYFKVYDLKLFFQPTCYQVLTFLSFLILIIYLRLST